MNNESREGTLVLAKLATAILVIFGALLIAVPMQKAIKYEVIDEPKIQAQYEEEFKDEDKQYFATYNKDYEDKTDKDSRKIIIDIDSYNVEKYNVAIINYLSNVNGNLLAINDYQISKSSLGSALGLGFGGNSASLGVGILPTTKIKSKNRYVLAVPKDAELADDLANRLKFYFRYGYEK